MAPTFLVMPADGVNTTDPTTWPLDQAIVSTTSVVAGLTNGVSYFAVTASGASDVFTPNPDPGRVYIVPFIGQSNGVGSNDGRTTMPEKFTPDAGILQLSGNAADGGDLVSAAERMNFPVFPSSCPNGKGYALPFAKALKLALGENDVIILVPLAVSGMAYFDPARWDVTGDLHANAIARVNAAKAAATLAYPAHEQRFIWLDAAGENDVTDIQSSSDWLNVVSAAYADLLAQTGSTGSPIIMPSMPHDWAKSGIKQRAVDSARKRLARTLPNVATVGSPAGYMSDSVHYDADGQALRGEAMAAVHPVALSRETPQGCGADWVDSAGATCEGAWSCWRRLRSSYNGPAFRLRRNDDSAEIDVGFTATGEIDYATFNNFVAGSPRSRIVRLYDQSGLGNDFVANSVDQIPEASLPTNTLDTVAYGDFFWSNGVPTFGGQTDGSQGSLIAPVEISAAGFAYIAADFKWEGIRHIFGSQNLQLTAQNVSGVWRSMAYHGGAAANGGFAMGDGFHSILMADQYARVDGEVLNMTELTAHKTTYSGATTLFARQMAAGGAIGNRSTNRMTELVFFSTQPDLAVIDEASAVYHYDAEA